ncbi:hypothetical protein Pyn_19893 [Prunus yedoensis var. nudiflora]|uniref:Uncharacterized protein n=1 Tax=Prunus yedoensis var. nudiflora TaxID=2094558 RepID=A0A314ZPE0_PRUYE|nr:hypothetical protein Pyn_19893 [Prunus yedoensis var. nudiflora]
MTCQFNEEGRAWHDDPTTTESNWLSTLVTSVVEVTALTKVGGKVLTIARMTTAYHVQSDNCCHGLKDGRRYCQDGDCLPRPGWWPPLVPWMAALAVIEVTALPLCLLHAACTLFLPTAGFFRLAEVSGRD